MTEIKMDKETLRKQEQHWENTFSNKPNMFGNSPSNAALKAAELFKKEGKTSLLELGGGQGRDTLFFAQSGFRVQVLDYCQSGVATITQKAETADLSQVITAKCQIGRAHV